ncbi:hypothetical protein EV127DRAFT_441890 [Xylaria flabelliformis]|nr:hypothetical protein EV127DRAFT_441890 [Xylaria flabelliformis]
MLFASIDKSGCCKPSVIVVVVVVAAGGIVGNVRADIVEFVVVGTVVAVVAAVVATATAAAMALSSEGTGAAAPVRGTTSTLDISQPFSLLRALCLLTGFVAAPGSAIQSPFPSTSCAGAARGSQH